MLPVSGLFLADGRSFFQCYYISSAECLFFSHLTRYATFWQYADSGPNPGDQDYFNGDAAGLSR